MVASSDTAPLAAPASSLSILAGAASMIKPMVSTKKPSNKGKVSRGTKRKSSSSSSDRDDDDDDEPKLSSSFSSSSSSAGSGSDDDEEEDEKNDGEGDDDEEEGEGDEDDQDHEDKPVPISSTSSSSTPAPFIFLTPAVAPASSSGGTGAISPPIDHTLNGWKDFEFSERKGASKLAQKRDAISAYVKKVGEQKGLDARIVSNWTLPQVFSIIINDRKTHDLLKKCILTSVDKKYLGDALQKGVASPYYAQYLQIFRSYLLKGNVTEQIVSNLCEYGNFTQEQGESLLQFNKEHMTKRASSSSSSSSGSSGSSGKKKKKLDKKAEKEKAKKKAERERKKAEKEAEKMKKKQEKAEKQRVKKAKGAADAEGAANANSARPLPPSKEEDGKEEKKDVASTSSLGGSGVASAPRRSIKIASLLNVIRMACLGRCPELTRKSPAAGGSASSLINGTNEAGAGLGDDEKVVVTESALVIYARGMLLTLSPMDPKYAIYQKLVQATPAKA